MYRLLAITLFAAIPILGNSQLIPWYFRNTAFKAWISENKISSLTTHTLPSENLSYTSGYYLAKGGDYTFVSYPNPNLTPEFRTEIGIYEYIFDELGNLDSMCVKVLEINCRAPEKDSFHLNADFRSRLNEMITTDYSTQFRIDTTGESRFRRGQTSKILQQCRFKGMNYFIDPTGKLWSAFNQSITIPGLKGTQVLDFRIKQTIKFINDEPVSIREYPFSGDFWHPCYRYWSVTPLNDSIQAIKVESSVYNQEYEVPYGVARDTSYYANSFIHQSYGTKTFYTTDRYFDGNIDGYPKVKLTNQLNQRIVQYDNFSFSLIGLFKKSNDWAIKNFYQLEIANFRAYENRSQYRFEYKDYFKRDSWSKTEVYSFMDDEKRLLYTEAPYEDGVKRVYNEKYKVNKRTQYFEHKGNEFRIYSYYPGSTHGNKTEIEVQTNNGYLEIGNFDAESSGDILKMTIGYR